MGDSVIPLARRTWWRASVADLIFLIVALGILPTMSATNLNDPGLGWHIRNIDAMIEAGGWLLKDPFSSTHAARTWYSNQWLGDLPLWLGWKWAGLNGVAAVGVIFLGFMYRYLYIAISEDGASWPAAALWTLLGCVGSYFAWVVRPNMVNPLFLLVTVRMCDQFHDGKKSRRQMLWLLPLFALWANIHGGFLGGLLTLAVVTAIEGAYALLALDERTRRFAWERFRFLVLLAAGAFAATLVNPYGIKLYPWIVRLVSSDLSFLGEWKSPDFNWGTWHGASRYEPLVVLFPALLALSRWRPNLVALGASVLWLHFALQSRRFLPLWVLVATPVMARAAGRLTWRMDLLGRIPISDDMRQLLARPSRSVSILPSAFVAFALLGWARLSEPLSLPNVPEAAMKQLLELDDGKTVIFNDANWGGYLTWHGWDRRPRFKTWIDDRYDVHGPDHFAVYFSIRDAHQGWQDQLTDRHIDVVGIATKWPLAERLTDNSDWQELHRDDQAVIFRRTGQ